jgi:hypothetical protein
MNTKTPRNVLLVLTSRETHEKTGTPTGCWLEELAGAYWTFADAGCNVALASTRGGRAPIDRSTGVIEASFRGGARVGWVNASWPFATLTANGSTLTLSSLGTYTFRPSDVVALEPYGSIPVLASGIRIEHNRKDYPKKMIFWCMGRRSVVLAEIANTGFSPAGHPIERASGFPIRWSTVVFVPFFTTKREGSGIGRTLVPQIAAAHGASVDIGETQGGAPRSGYASERDESR